ncbi:MAG: hypothetical protein AB7I27_16640 [Bacteriovoracaceae bacterium]
MKTLLLALILGTSLSTKSFAEESSSYEGKTQVNLKYNGWVDGCRGSAKEFGVGGAYVGALFIGTGHASWAMAAAGGAGGFLLVGGITLALCAESDSPKEKLLSVKLKTVVTSVGTDRINLFITGPSKKGCAPLNISAIGESDGFGNYELFVNKEAYVDNKVLGTLSRAGDKFQLNITNPLSVITQGKKGHDCIWDMKHGLSVELAAK